MPYKTSATASLSQSYSGLQKESGWSDADVHPRLTDYEAVRNPTIQQPTYEMLDSPLGTFNLDKAPIRCEPQRVDDGVLAFPPPPDRLDKHSPSMIWW